MAAGGYLEVKVFDNGHSAGVVRLSPDCVRLRLYCNRILMDDWCYELEQAALAAIGAWDGEGEPAGWTRHPRTGRHRPNGDPSQEFVLERPS